MKELQPTTRVCAVIAIFLATVSGCSPDFHKADADKEVYQIIDEKWRPAFGQKANYVISDANAIPSPNDVNVEKPSVTEEPLSLAQAVAIATKYNRDYQTRKEDLYLSALALTGERYKYALKWFGTIDAKYARGIDDKTGTDYEDTSLNGEIIYLPKSTQWVELIKKVTDENNPMCCGSEAYYRQRKNSIVKDPRLITRWLNSKLQKSEAESVKVKSAGYNQWWVGGNSRALFLHEALTKVACQYGINAKDAGGILVDAQENGVSNIWILDKRSQMKIAAELYKMAQPPMPQETTQEQQVPAQNGQFDPSQGGQVDPYAQQMQGPPPISPTDLAIGEAVQRLTQQSEMQAQQIQSQMEQSQQAMEMQQQNTQQLVSVLQGIQQRATEISQASQGGTSIPQGAMGSPMAAAEMIAPPVPEEEPPPPMPVMEGDVPDPNTLDQEINPEMIEQVDSLQDEGVFDTAAISMLSASPGLQSIVASYIPNMEKCVDNLGRVLLTLWLTEGDTRNNLGDETFVMLEDKLRTVFKGLGDTILSISHNALASGSDDMQNKRVSSTMQ